MNQQQKQIKFLRRAVKDFADTYTKWDYNYNIIKKEIDEGLENLINEKANDDLSYLEKDSYIKVTDSTSKNTKRIFIKHEMIWVREQFSYKRYDIINVNLHDYNKTIKKFTAGRVKKQRKQFKLYKKKLENILKDKYSKV